jgi:putative aldouronate transport system permease protein
MRPSVGSRAFNLFNVLFMALLGIATLYPFVNNLAVSLSNSAYVQAGKVTILPKGPHLEAYQAVLGDPKYWLTFRNTVGIVAVGTALAMVMTSIMAYPLSRKHLRGRSLIMIYIIITMFFQGGIIPTYLLMEALGLLNTFAVLVVPQVINAWYLILLRNFYMTVPVSLEESARMDGANDLTILGKIFIPLSMPAMATISLFYAVNYWSTFFTALIYITDYSKQVLQVYLSEFIIDEARAQQHMDSLEEYLEKVKTIPESIKAAALMATLTPILLVYPFIQKHFVKGVIVGSLKG